MRIKTHPLCQAGDTIVEVLIAIAVMSLVLGGAFVSTHRSLQTTRDTQERGEALKVAQTQLEELKSLVATNAPAVFGSSFASNFCVVTTPSLSIVDSTSPGNCAFDSAGNAATVEPIYHMSIKLDAPTNTFTLQAKWAKVGIGTDELQLIYRLYDD
jgi:type II secretory pathway pseudopilin PulG